MKASFRPNLSHWMLSTCAQTVHWPILKGLLDPTITWTCSQTGRWMLDPYLLLPSCGSGCGPINPLGLCFLVFQEKNPHSLSLPMWAVHLYIQITLWSHPFPLRHCSFAHLKRYHTWLSLVMSPTDAGKSGQALYIHANLHTYGRSLCFIFMQWIVWIKHASTETQAWMHTSRRKLAVEGGRESVRWGAYLLECLSFWMFIHLFGNTLRRP